MTTEELAALEAYSQAALAPADNHADPLPGNDDPFESLPKTRPNKLPPIRPVNELCGDATLTTPREIIEGFLHQGLKGVLGSASKARKTWILMDMAVCVATGTPFWGRKTISGKVLYINFEIPDAFAKSRFSKIIESKGISDCTNLDVWNLRGYAAPLNVLEAEMIRRLKDGAYVLVIIDPIYKGMGGREENAAGDVADLCNELERIAVQTNAAVVYAAHFSKGNQAGKEAMDRISGSGVWARDADSLMIMTKHEEDDCFAIEIIVRNLPEQDPFVVRWNFPFMEIEPDLSPEDLKEINGRPKAHDKFELLAVIRNTTESKPISIQQWAILADVKRQTLSNYANKLRSKGFIKSVGDGKQARQFITPKGIQAVNNL